MDKAPWALLTVHFPAPIQTPKEVRLAGGSTEYPGGL